MASDGVVVVRMVMMAMRESSGFSLSDDLGVPRTGIRVVVACSTCDRSVGEAHCNNNSLSQMHDVSLLHPVS